MKTIKWAVIGAGGIAKIRTIPAIVQYEGSELVALMDNSEKVASEMGEEYGVPYFTSEEEMFRSVDFDAVYISTPLMCHYDQAMLALKYGKHVLMEKPVALTSKEARTLVDAFKAAGLQFSVGYMMKYHNLHEKTKEIIKAGNIGQVNSMRLQFAFWYPDIPGSWRQKKALGGGGAIMDIGVHCIELAEYLLDDEIEDVKCIYSTRTFSYDVDDGAIIVFRTKEGVLGHIDVNFNIPYSATGTKVEVYGTHGNIICTNTLSQVEGGTLSHFCIPKDNPADNCTVIYNAGNSNLYVKQIRIFSDLLCEGRTDYFYADRAVQVQEIVDRIYENN